MAANDNFNLLGLQANLDESFNTDNSVDNSTETEVELEDSLNDNSDNSTNLDVEDSGNTDSYNDTEVEVEVEVEDSFNDNSDNSTDNSIEDSYNDNSEHFKDSFNTTTLIDNSVTAGVHQYNAGIGDIDLSGLGGGGGKGWGGGGDTDIDITNRPTIVGQSVNQNIDTGGGYVEQDFEFEAQVASGDYSVAAGDDANVDNSTTEINVGDVWIGNEWETTTISDSFNDSSTNTEYDLDVDIEDSFNQEEETNVDVEVEDSFNNEWETDIDNDFEWENSGNFFSPDAVTVNDNELEI